MKKRNGFTLVELLAVIVILAIILVIAVPSIMNTIKDARKASYESTAKMVASAAETQYMVALTLDKVVSGDYPASEGDVDATKFYTGSSTKPAPCGAWANLDANEYGACTYYIDSAKVAHITIAAKDTSTKFKNCTVSGATKSSASATGGNCE